MRANLLVQKNVGGNNERGGEMEEKLLRNVSLLSRRVVTISGFIFLLAVLVVSLPIAEAAVVVEKMHITQGTRVEATVPQLQDGPHPRILSHANELFRNVVLTAYRRFEQAALETRADPHLPEHMRDALTFRADYEIFRNDLQFLSLGQTVYQYTGGAHGMSFLTAFTIQLPAGRVCKLADLFVAGTNYRDRLTAIVRREGASRGLPLWDFQGVKEDAGFYLTDDGLVLFFQPYEIAPYSEGIVKMLVRYRDLADVLAFKADQ